MMMDLSKLVQSTCERLVAVEALPDGTAELFSRDPSGAVASRIVECKPWLLTAGPELGAALAGNCGVEPLEGEGAMRCRIVFPDEKSHDAAVKQLKKLTGQNPSSPLAPYRVFSDPIQRALMALKARLFRGMEFRELRRMQLDIETRCTVPGTFCNAEREGDEVILVSLKDSDGFEVCLSSRQEGGEAALLARMVAVIQERDPDVLEGHNLFNFDLDYLEKRCKRHGVALAIGRGGRLPQARASRLSIAERTLNYRRYDVYGRHVVDTYHLVQLADVSRRDMDSYGLKYAAKYYGIAREGRVYVQGDDITATFDNDPERLSEYCLDDVRETDGLSRILSPSHFYQTQLLPLSYQNCVLRGNATRIDGLLTAEYLAAGAALPAPQAPVPFEGALSEAAKCGVFKPVWHIDVRSLYPSIILSERLAPASDRLGVFLRLLEQLREFRLAAKDAMKASEGAERDHYAALQSSFKILINSFYGYLGFAQGTFNDYGMAEKVTATGRGILTGMSEHLEAEGASVIELDTDGIYFVPPPAIHEVDEMRRRIQEELPPGIAVELDGTYSAMFSYKSKNYALREADGRISLHGAALRSRGLEPFQRRFVAEAIDRILSGRAAELPALFREYEEALLQHKLPLQDFLRKENLTMTPGNYKAALAAGKTKRSAIYELALRSSQEFRPGDGLKYYVTGAKKSVSVVENSKLAEAIDASVRDENVPFYLDRLKGVYEKLAAAVGSAPQDGK